MRGGVLLLLAVVAAFPAATQPRATQPRATPPAAGRQATELDALLDALKAAPTEPAAALLQARIGQLWLAQGGPAAALLIGRGERNLQGNAADEALADFDAALTLAPDLAEAYNRRAMAHFELGDYPHALADLQEALRRDPRHFSAFRTLSRIAEAREDWKGALAAWQKLLEFSPKAPDGEDRLKALRKKALGEES
jgi:tetratricopeptide (TPR) repeat protein